MKRILCFGDSNTWGYIAGEGKRYPEDYRWPSLLQRQLGSDYEIIEFGINGMTTCFDRGDSDFKNGKTALGYALLANYPLDGIIIMLGTNDLIEKSAYQASKGAKELVNICRSANIRFGTSQPIFNDGFKILLVSPIQMGKDIKDNPFSILYKNAYEESLLLGQYYKEIAISTHVDYLDAAKYGEASAIDCLHLNKDSHQSLANAIAYKLKQIYEGE